MDADTPLGLKVSLDLVIVVSIVLAFVGPAPRRRHSERAIAWLTAIGAACWTLGVLDALAGVGEGEPLLGPSVLLLCLARWLTRAPGDDGGLGRDPEPADDGPPPVDWEAFDRSRGDWDRPHALL